MGDLRIIVCHNCFHERATRLPVGKSQCRKCGKREVVPE